MMTFAYAIKKKISLSIQLLNGLVVQGGWNWPEILNIRNIIVMQTAIWQQSKDHCRPEHNLILISSLSFSFSTTILPTIGPFKDCFQVRQAGHATSGMYLLKTDANDRLIQAWCEHGLDNGGWTVLQRRKDGSVNFFRNWENYKVRTVFKAFPFSFPQWLSLSSSVWGH